MKLLLVTLFEVNNYGAVLQAYALQKILEQYGDVELLNYHNRHLSKSLDVIRWVPSLHGLMGAVKDVLRVFPRRRAMSKFHHFIHRRLRLTEPLDAKALKAGACDGYDIYIVGSDQVWNPLCVSDCGRLDPVYFLAFTPSEACRLSYASSKGSYVYSAGEERQVMEYLSGFKAVSVREADTQHYLSDRTGRDVQHSLDPSMLLDQHEWDDLLPSRPARREPYLLVYTVPKAGMMREAVAHFAARTGLRVVALDQGLRSAARAHDQVRDAGPEEFIELFRNAAFVVTDSFHGVCFSAVFEKPFAVVSPGMHANRVESLLTLLGLDARYVRQRSDLADIELVLDFAPVRKRLQAERSRSLQYLAQALAP